MRKNIITVIELVIVLCVIVVTVMAWTNKKPESKTLSLSPTMNTTKEKCPKCGNDIIIIELGIVLDGKEFYETETDKKCNKCGWHHIEKIQE